MHKQICYSTFQKYQFSLKIQRFLLKLRNARQDNCNSTSIWISQNKKKTKETPKIENSRQNNPAGENWIWEKLAKGETRVSEERERQRSRTQGWNLLGGLNLSQHQPVTERGSVKVRERNGTERNGRCEHWEYLTAPGEVLDKIALVFYILLA